MQNTTNKHNSVNNVDGALVFCMSPDDVLYLYQVSQKYLKGFQNYETDTNIYKGAKKIFLASAKCHRHIFNMLITSVQSFKLIA